ncbi:MAG: hypothetical protein QOJ40_4 [Verrucomicrobiota bacterium]
MKDMGHGLEVGRVTPRAPSACGSVKFGCIFDPLDGARGVTRPTHAAPDHER